MEFALYKFQELLFLLNRPTRRAESRADIRYLFITTKRAIHRHVCCTRIWRTEQSSKQRKRACLKRVTFQISAIKLASNPQQSPFALKESSDESKFTCDLRLRSNLGVRNCKT